MNKKIVLLRRFQKHDLEYIVNNLSNYYKIIIPEDYSEEKLCELVTDADVLIGNTVSKKVLDSAKNLKVFQVPGAGVDKIDLSIFKNKGIKLFNSHSNSYYVAEYAIGLMFSLIKKICNNDRNMRDGKWLNPNRDIENVPDTINRKTIGFLGFGNIGQNIASNLKGFDIKILAFDSKKDSDESKLNVSFESLEKVLKESDIIFNVLPLTKDTKDLIKMKEFLMMKKTSFLINISRGRIINEKDLFEALEDKIIAGAAIDVWYDDVYDSDKGKFPSKKYDFHKLENIVLSPYCASISKLKSTHIVDVVSNLKKFAQGGNIINIVDLTEGY
jgi:D-3-phosphoglycerate dehydrogenase